MIVPPPRPPSYKSRLRSWRGSCHLAWRASVCPRRDHRRGSTFRHCVQHPIRVTGLVAHQHLTGEIVQAFRSSLEIMSLIRQNPTPDPMSDSIREGNDLAGQSPFRAADSFRFRSPFWAPEAHRCAGMIGPSTDTIDRSRSPDHAWTRRSQRFAGVQRRKRLKTRVHRRAPWVGHLAWTQRCHPRAHLIRQHCAIGSHHITARPSNACCRPSADVRTAHRP